MNQSTIQKFESECKLVSLFIHNEMKLGPLHDFLAHMQGVVIQKMQELAKSQIDQAKSVPDIEAPREEVQPQA